MSNKVTIVIPTRGVIVGECIQSILQNVKEAGVEYRLITISGLSIPDCFNQGVLEALQEPTDYIWFVEEDVITPRLGLKKLLQAEADVAVIDYPMKNGYGTVAYHNGKPMWCGTGCTLIKRNVFEKIGQPYFRTDILYEISIEGKFSERKVPAMLRYGGHDIRFGLVVNKLGLNIKSIPNETCIHKKLISLGQAGTNSGAHTFQVLTTIEKPSILKKNPLPCVTVNIDKTSEKTYDNYVSL